MQVTSDDHRMTSPLPGNLDISSILASRICHDLVSPIGAIVNGVDLVRELGGMDVDAEIAMISQSSDRASALLKYYRIAFGDAAEGSAISRAALREQAVAFLGSSRITVEWSEDQGPALSRMTARLLFLLLMCARGLAGMHGVLSVRLPRDTEMPMEIRVDGAFSPDANEMLAHLSGDANASAVTPRLIEFVLSRTSSANLGVTLSIVRDDGSVSIRAAHRS